MCALPFVGGDFSPGKKVLSTGGERNQRGGPFVLIRRKLREVRSNILEANGKGEVLIGEGEHGSPRKFRSWCPSFGGLWGGEPRFLWRRGKKELVLLLEFSGIQGMVLSPLHLGGDGIGNAKENMSAHGVSGLNRGEGGIQMNLKKKSVLLSGQASRMMKLKEKTPSELENKRCMPNQVVKSSEGWSGNPASSAGGKVYFNATISLLLDVSGGDCRWFRKTAVDGGTKSVV